MKKNYFLSILFFVVGIYSGFAQKISSEKGLTTATFQVPEGKIKIYLPDDLRTGDIISGTVVAEPDGKNEKQIKKNADKLVKYIIDFNFYCQKLNCQSGSYCCPLPERLYNQRSYPCLELLVDSC